MMIIDSMIPLEKKVALLRELLKKKKSCCNRMLEQQKTKNFLMNRLKVVQKELFITKKKLDFLQFTYYASTDVISQQRLELLKKKYLADIDLLQFELSCLESL